MASGGHMLAQQQQGVETQIKTLVNADLKEICRAWGYQVSGTKAQLQTRCSAILRELIQKGDAKGFEELRYRAGHRGQPPPPPNPTSSTTNGYAPTGVSHSHYNMGPGRGISTANRLPAGGKYFTPSPFYEVVDTVLPLQDLPDGPEMPQNRHTVRANIVLSADHVQKLTSDRSLKVLLYCGLAHGMSTHHPVDIAFPNQIEVKVNDDDVKSNFKGLKNKPGSTKPAELTNLRYKQGYSNQLTITYALTTKRYAYVVYLVKYITAATLTERIKRANVIPKQSVIDDMNKSNADTEIEATSTRMSLKDPISTVRIGLPVRSTVCKHNQCFDGAMFMQLQEQAPQWLCPVCSKHVSFQSLCVDKYFEDILNRTSSSVEKVDVEPNGEWKVIKEDEDKQPNGTSNKPRASYDDDFDDELVEVVDPPNKYLNGLKRESQPPNNLSPMTTGGFPMNTPPLSSREPSVAQSTASAQRPSNKRPAGAVIDLTLSDDEDEQPPRPAKRQTVVPLNTSTSTSARPYNTPASIPDQHHYRPPYVPRQADSYRPSSHAGPPPSPHFGSVGSPNNPQSPLRTSSSYGGGGGGAWPNHSNRAHSQQTNGIPPFSIRPSPSDSRPTQEPSTPQGPGNLRLPPMQTHPHHMVDQYQQASGWRSDYGSYSNSPGG